ncbi:MAG TPA: DNA-processing protein DprA [Thiolinea sp.]|nr:DNA-processing protein DprA [Thiolinea sp.]
MPVDEQELHARLQLWRAPGIGTVSFQRLLGCFGAIAHALEASDAELRQAGLKPAALAGLRQLDPLAARADMEWLHQQHNHHILFIDSPGYPLALKNIAGSPPVLFVTGNPQLLQDPQIAMIGTRNPTSGGRENARAFARHLSQSGITITSGMALGIDAESHQGALEADAPTIAVVATGLDIVYPARNRRLAEQIAHQGALVSEFPIGIKPHADNFPRRNRVISGLAVGTLVVEAALRSGSLVTARHAMEQGREVFAIPGSIHNPLAKGCHQLIREGAKLVETATDILEEVAAQLHSYLDNTGTTLTGTRKPQPDHNQSADPDPAPYAPAGDELQVLAALGHDPVPVDQIVMDTGLTPEAASSMLLVLELQGHVAACGGGHYMRLGPRD